MRQKWLDAGLDRLIAVLSWTPSAWVKMPVIALFAVGPAAYVLFSTPRPQPPSPSSSPAEVEAEAELESAAATVVGRPEPPAPPQGAAAQAPADPQAMLWQGMATELESSARNYPGSVAIYVKDLKRGWEWTYHADDLFPAASLIKVPVMVGVFDKISRGELSLNSPVMLRRSVRMGGSGSIKWLRDGTRFTVLRLLEKLIHESDNTAQRMLIEEVGMGFLQRQFPKMGLVYTEIYPEGLSLSSAQVKYENYTTAREMSMLLEKIYKGEAVDKYSSQLMLDILKRRRVRSRLAKSLPAGWEIAHKTGLLRRACHDSSIIFSPQGDYVLTVMTGRNRNYQSAKNFISRLGRITYRHYGSDRGLLAKARAGSAGNAR